MIVLFPLLAAAATERPETHGMEIQTAWITMPDGVRLSADLYMPTGGRACEKFPVLLEYLPYRKHESRSRNRRVYSCFVRRGYAMAAVDIRGTGNSEGRLIPHEYSEIEQKDGESVIDWLSKQPWSNGNIGMYGGSYGAFNSIWTAAAVRPPALKAVFAMCGTDDRYTDDIHHPGGSMLMVDNSWALAMVTSNAMPGAPGLELNSKASLDRWETPPWIQEFLHHQVDGPYYRRGSLAPGYERLTVPTYLVGGYLDEPCSSQISEAGHLHTPKRTSCQAEIDFIRVNATISTIC